jgi:quinol monooxygenase YgiN
MADRTKIVVARVYPKPGRLQEVIDVYAGIAPVVYEEPGCELFCLHTDGETVFVVEKWATPAGLQGHAAGPAYAQIRAGISERPRRGVCPVDGLAAAASPPTPPQRTRRHSCE